MVDFEADEVADFVEGIVEAIAMVIERATDTAPPVQTRYRLSVENLSTRCSWQDLKDLMRSAGEVTYADAHKKERNTAVVCFGKHDDLKRAIDKFQGKEINGRKIKLIDETRSASRSRSRSRSPRDRSRSPRSRSRSRSPIGNGRSASRSPN
ncbi:RRM domain-containing protein [Aphelenchoides bicaudatus]|nr:RRM domain-containing protein [Aphelenchoides bicaudatus]